MFTRIRNNRKIQRLVKSTPVYPVIQNWQFKSWERHGYEIPAPNAVKQRIVKQYARQNKLQVLVETGTFYGDMIYACRHDFHKIYSIELDNQLWRSAKHRFSNYSHIEILEGDSGIIISKVLGCLTQPAVFWLDAHYMAMNSIARGLLDSPIIQEISHILGHGVQGHVILVDDSRHFNGESGYPTIPEFRAWINRERPGWVFENRHDIIRIFNSLYTDIDF